MKGSELSPQDSSRFRVEVPLWLEYKCEQTIPSMHIYTHTHTHTTHTHTWAQGNIKHVKNINNNSIQDIKHKWERDKQSKHGRIISRFEYICSMSPPSTLWRIFAIIDPARSLGAATPTMSFLKNSWTYKSLTCSRKNNTRKQSSLPRPHLYTELP